MDSLARALSFTDHVKFLVRLNIQELINVPISLGKAHVKWHATHSDSIPSSALQAHEFTKAILPLLKPKDEKSKDDDPGADSEQVTSPASPNPQSRRQSIPQPLSHTITATKSRDFSDSDRSLQHGRRSSTITMTDSKGSSFQPLSNVATLTRKSASTFIARLLHKGQTDDYELHVKTRKVYINENHLFAVSIPVSHNTLSPCPLRFEVFVTPLKGSKPPVTSSYGILALDLSEFTEVTSGDHYSDDKRDKYGKSGRKEIERTYLLEKGKTNTLLKVSVEVVPFEGTSSIQFHAKPFINGVYEEAKRSRPGSRLSSRSASSTKLPQTLTPKSSNLSQSYQPSKGSSSSGSSRRPSLPRSSLSNFSTGFQMGKVNDYDEDPYELIEKIYNTDLSTREYLPKELQSDDDHFANQFAAFRNAMKSPDVSVQSDSSTNHSKKGRISSVFHRSKGSKNNHSTTSLPSFATSSPPATLNELPPVPPLPRSLPRPRRPSLSISTSSPSVNTTPSWNSSTTRFSLEGSMTSRLSPTYSDRSESGSSTDNGHNGKSHPTPHPLSARPQLRLSGLQTASRRAPVPTIEVAEASIYTDSDSFTMVDGR